MESAIDPECWEKNHWWWFLRIFKRPSCFISAVLSLKMSVTGTQRFPNYLVVFQWFPGRHQQTPPQPSLSACHAAHGEDLTASVGDDDGEVLP